MLLILPPKLLSCVAMSETLTTKITTWTVISIICGSSDPIDSLAVVGSLISHCNFRFNSVATEKDNNECFLVRILSQEGLHTNLFNEPMNIAVNQSVFCS